jgi:hypothetical protein
VGHVFYVLLPVVALKTQTASIKGATDLESSTWPCFFDLGNCLRFHQIARPPRRSCDRGTQIQIDKLPHVGCYFRR